jgi:hypothetical protein
MRLLSQRSTLLRAIRSSRPPSRPVTTRCSSTSSPPGCTRASGRRLTAVLRAARLQIVGSGQGSVGAREYLAELPALAQEIAAGTFDVDALAMPLADVEQAWAAAADARKRIVFTPQP